MRKEKFETKKSLGQHFLINTHVPKAMADAGEVREGDHVLEIGPGTGALTRELLSRGAHVTALEVDRRAIAVLTEEFADEIASKKLRLIHGDVRTLPIQSLYKKTGSFKVVANIPYYLSGMLFRLFLEGDIQPNTLVFLVQKEVALRIARDKKESLLSLSVKAYGDPTYVKTVGKGNFAPPPKLDSAIIKVGTISKKRLDKVSEKFFFEILHAGFGSKRKQLLGNLSALFPRETLESVFQKLDISTKIRGEDVSLPSWVELSKNLSTVSLEY